MAQRVRFGDDDGLASSGDAKAPEGSTSRRRKGSKKSRRHKDRRRDGSDNGDSDGEAAAYGMVSGGSLRGPSSQGTQPVRQVQKETAQWRAFTRRHALLPVDPARVPMDQSSRGYVLLLDRATVSVPAALRQLASHRFSVTARVSLFNLTQGAFIGRTFRTKHPRRVPAGATQGAVSVQLNEVLYLHTRVTDPATLAVVELVLTVRDRGGELVGNYSAGWSYFRLLNPPPPSLVAGNFDDKAESLSVGLRAGSPRVLPFSRTEADLSHVRTLSRCTITYRVADFTRQLKRITHLVPENLLFDGEDVIPGLHRLRVPSQTGGSDRLVPRLLSAEEVAEIGNGVDQLLNPRAAARKARQARRKKAKKKGGRRTGGAGFLDDDDSTGDEDAGDDGAGAGADSDSDGGAPGAEMPLAQPVKPKLDAPLKLKLRKLSVYLPAGFDGTFVNLVTSARALQLGVHVSQLEPPRVLARTLVIGLHNGLREVESHAIQLDGKQENGVVTTRKSVTLRKYSPHCLMAVKAMLVYHVVLPPRPGHPPAVKLSSAARLPEYRELEALQQAPGTETTRTVLVGSQVFVPSNGTTLFTSNTAGRTPLTGCPVEVPLKAPRLSRGSDLGTRAPPLMNGALEAVATDVYGLTRYGDNSIIVGFKVETQEYDPDDDRSGSDRDRDRDRDDDAPDDLEDKVWNVDDADDAFKRKGRTPKPRTPKKKKKKHKYKSPSRRPPSPLITPRDDDYSSDASPAEPPFIASPPRRRTPKRKHKPRRREPEYDSYDEDEVEEEAGRSPRRLRPARRTYKHAAPPPSPSIDSNASSASVDSDGSGDSARVPLVRLMNDPLVAEGMMLRLHVDSQGAAARAGNVIAPPMANRTLGAGAPMGTLPLDTVMGTRTLGAGATGVPSAGGAMYTPRAAGTLGSNMPPLAADLTRAARTQLSALGFDNTAMDRTRGVRTADITLGGTLAGPPPELGLELSDPLQGNQIRVQLAAFRALAPREMGHTAPPPVPRTIFFTFTFYTFDAVKTPRLDLSRVSGSEPPLYVLYTSPEDAGMFYNGDGESKLGLGAPNPAHEFRIDPTLVAPDETRNFATYLRDKAMQIEVWDAETLLPVGEVIVELNGLMRQQQRSVKLGREYDVVASSVTSDIQTTVQVGGHGTATAGDVVGKLQVLMSNEGFRGVGAADASKTVVRPSGYLLDSDATVEVVAGKTITKAVARRMNLGPEIAGAGVAESEVKNAADVNADVLTYEEVRMLKRRYDPEDRGSIHYKEFLNDMHTNPASDMIAAELGDLSEGKGSEGKRGDGVEAWVKANVVTDLTRAFRRNVNARAVMAQCDLDSDGMLSQGELVRAAAMLQCDWGRDVIDGIMTVHGKQYPDRTVRGVYYEDLLDLVHQESKGTGTPALLSVVQGKYRTMTRKHPTNRLETNLVAVPYKKPGVLAWPDFFTALRNWGFTVQEHRQSDESAALARSQTDAIQRWKQESGVGVGSRPKSEAEERAEWQAAQRELQRASIIREGRKRQLFSERLRQRITTEYHVYPSFGKRLFFELKVTNPFSREDTFVIHAEDPRHELRVVTDSNEWRFLRRVVPRACGDAGDTPIEDGMISAAHELLLGPNETVFVPFTFLSLASGRVVRGEGGAAATRRRGVHESLAEFVRAQDVPMQERTIVVTVGGSRNSQAIAMLKVHIHPRPFVLDRTIRFYNAEHEVLKRTIIMQAGSGAFIGDAGAGTWDGDFEEDVLMGKYAYCSDDNVVCSSQAGRRGTREIKFRCRCGDSLEKQSFYVLLYNDQYNAMLHQVWRVWVHPMLRHDVHAVMGQATKVSLRIKADASRRVRPYTTAPNEIKYRSRATDLVRGSFNAVELMYQPLSAGRKHVHVHLIDVDSRQLVQAWRLTVSSAPPQVSQTYTLTLPVGHAFSKKIGYSNPWPRPRVFLLKSSNPTMLRLRDSRIDVAARARSFIRFNLPAVEAPRVEEFYVFINDEAEQNEECLMLKVNYQ